MSKRQSNRPDRRIAPAAASTQLDRDRIKASTKYVGMATHKRHPGDYGFNPPVSPRPSKSLCDDVRTILRNEATRLFHQGIAKGMVSKYVPGGLPKYIWSVDGDGYVYEAKAKPDQEAVYHGYRLGEDDRDMRAEVLKEWNQR
jgi:hypothetical protein